MLFDERLDKSEDGPHLEAAVRLFIVARIGISLADLRPQHVHVIDEQTGHALNFFEIVVEVHSGLYYRFSLTQPTNSSGQISVFTPLSRHRDGDRTGPTGWAHGR